MASPLHALDPAGEEGKLRVVVEVPKGGRAKLKWARGWSGRAVADKLVTKCARAFRRKK